MILPAKPFMTLHTDNMTVDLCLYCQALLPTLTLALDGVPQPTITDYNFKVSYTFLPIPTISLHLTMCKANQNSEHCRNKCNKGVSTKMW